MKEKFLMEYNYPVWEDVEVVYGITPGDAKKATRTMNLFMNVVTKIRTIRSEMNIPPSVKLGACYTTEDQTKMTSITEMMEPLLRMSKIKTLYFISATKFEYKGSFEMDGVYILLQGISEITISHINREIAIVNKDIDFLSKELSNKGFIKKAPSHIVSAKKEKLKNAIIKRKTLLDKNKS